MPERHSTDGARTESRSDPSGIPLLLQPGCICTAKYLNRAIGVSRDTLRDWEDAGLRVIRAGTGSGLFYTDDVIKFLLEQPLQPRKKRPRKK